MAYASLLAEQVPQFLQRPGAVVVDVRDARSYAQDHLPGARPASDATIKRLIQEKQPDRPILVYCYHGNSSRDLCTLLGGFGFTRVYNLEGGWQAWTGYRDRLTVSLSVPATVWMHAAGFEVGNLASRIGNGMTALMLAAKEGRAEIVTELVEAGADLDALNNDQNPALWFACVCGDLAIVRYLIERGANLDNQNVNGATCLIYAASAGRFEVVRVLAEAGADLARETLDGFNALDSAATLPVLRFLKPRYAAVA